MMPTCRRFYQGRLFLLYWISFQTVSLLMLSNLSPRYSLICPQYSSSTSQMRYITPLSSKISPQPPPSINPLKQSHQGQKYNFFLFLSQRVNPQSACFCSGGNSGGARSGMLSHRYSAIVRMQEKDALFVHFMAGELWKLGPWWKIDWTQLRRQVLLCIVCVVIGNLVILQSKQCEYVRLVINKFLEYQQKLQNIAMSQNQPSIQLPQSPEQQLSQADYLNSLPPKLHQILLTLTTQFLELQQKYCSSYKKLQKQLQEKDRLILSLTKINSTLMRENARMKKKSDAQFQYFVKRIAETQCQAIKEKRALEDALLMCQGVIGRLGGEERGRESGQGGQGERDKNMVVAECKISSEEIQDRINSVKDLNIQLMNLPSTPKSPKKSPKPHLKASTTAREPASTKKQNLSDQKQRGGVNSLFIYTNPQKEEPRFSGNRPKRQLAIEVQI